MLKAHQNLDNVKLGYGNEVKYSQNNHKLRAPTTDVQARMKMYVPIPSPPPRIQNVLALFLQTQDEVEKAHQELDNAKLGYEKEVKRLQNELRAREKEVQKCMTSS